MSTTALSDGATVAYISCIHIPPPWSFDCRSHPFSVQWISVRRYALEYRHDARGANGHKWNAFCCLAQLQTYIYVCRRKSGSYLLIKPHSYETLASLFYLPTACLLYHPSSFLVPRSGSDPHILRFTATICTSPSTSTLAIVPFQTRTLPRILGTKRMGTLGGCGPSTNIS